MIKRLKFKVLTLSQDYFPLSSDKISAILFDLVFDVTSFYDVCFCYIFFYLKKITNHEFKEK